MNVVRSEGIEATDGANGLLVWKIQFTHAGCVRAGQIDWTLCSDTFMQSELWSRRRVWLQKTCGCAVTLRREDKQTIWQCWEVQRRLATTTEQYREWGIDYDVDAQQVTWKVFC